MATPCPGPPRGDVLDRLNAVAIQHGAVESMKSVGPFERHQTKLGAAIGEGK
jgi:hypothetical protein